MPIEPIDLSKKTGGEGNEKYNPPQKRGPGPFDEVLERAKTDRIKPSGGGGGGAAGDTKFLKPKYKAGGKVRKFNDGGLADAGFSAGLGPSGLSKTDRTPERRALELGLKEGSPNYKKAVETFNRQKKVPGLPGDSITQQNKNPIIQKAKDIATSVMSRTPSAIVAKKGMEMAKKYPRGSEGESAFEEEMGMKKGGKVSSASKRADGCAIRGKTRA